MVVLVSLSAAGNGSRAGHPTIPPSMAICPPGPISPCPRPTMHGRTLGSQRTEEMTGLTASHRACAWHRCADAPPPSSPPPIPVRPPSSIVDSPGEQHAGGDKGVSESRRGTARVVPANADGSGTPTYASARLGGSYVLARRMGAAAVGGNQRACGEGEAPSRVPSPSPHSHRQTPERDADPQICRFPERADNASSFRRMRPDDAPKRVLAGRRATVRRAAAPPPVRSRSPMGALADSAKSGSHPKRTE